MSRQGLHVAVGQVEWRLLKEPGALLGNSGRAKGSTSGGKGAPGFLRFCSDPTRLKIPAWRARMSLSYPVSRTRSKVNE